MKNGFNSAFNTNIEIINLNLKYRPVYLMETMKQM